MTINIHVKSDTVSQLWRDENVERIVSIKHDTTELLYSGTVLTFYDAFGMMSMDNLVSMISCNFSILQSQLQIIANKLECNKKFYLSIGLAK